LITCIVLIGVGVAPAFTEREGAPQSLGDILAPIGRLASAILEKLGELGDTFLPITPGEEDLRPPSIPPSETTSPPSELVAYALELINNDRADYGLPPVELGDNIAAQEHAEEMLQNKYLSHWNLAGLKPHMRYTLYGGEGSVAENAAYMGFFYDEPHAATVDPKTAIAQLEYDMMYDDAASNWGHRDTILNRWHNKVNIGISYDENNLALVQDFENNYIIWDEPPRYEDGLFTLEGRTTLGKVVSIVLYYDPPPQPLTKTQLINPPYDGSYSLGEEAGYILPSRHYVEGADYIHASRWVTTPSGDFEIEADITPLLQLGNGVYTAIVWSEVGEEYVDLTTYSIFIGAD